MLPAVKRPLILWLLADGKPGHENQSLGLAEAIGRRVPCHIHRIPLAGKRGILGRIRAAVLASTSLPKPDLILGAGHATHAALWWLGRKNSAPTVVLMKPSMPIGWFSFCLCPEHDFPAGAEKPGLILTRGALNRVVAGDGEKTGKLILIGGPSKTHGWDGGAVLDRLAQATDRGGWELSDSRRTPQGFLEEARAKLPGVTLFSHRDTPADWVAEKLRGAKEVWVTEDSVSMVYEALTSGARVGLLPAPRRAAASRVIQGIESLIAEGFVTPFDRWRESQRIAAPPHPLQEADRCAAILLERIGRETTP